MLEDAGLIENREGRYELTPKGIRRIGQNALADLFTKLAKDKMGQHELDRTGSATNAATRPSRTSWATRSTSTSSAPSATRSAPGVGHPRAAHHRTTSRSS